MNLIRFAKNILSRFMLIVMLIIAILSSIIAGASLLFERNKKINEDFTYTSIKYVVDSLSSGHNYVLSGNYGSSINILKLRVNIRCKPAVIYYKDQVVSLPLNLEIKIIPFIRNLLFGNNYDKNSIPFVGINIEVSDIKSIQKLIEDISTKSTYDKSDFHDRRKIIGKKNRDQKNIKIKNKTDVSSLLYLISHINLEYTVNPSDLEYILDRSEEEVKDLEKKKNSRNKVIISIINNGKSNNIDNIIQLIDKDAIKEDFFNDNKKNIGRSYIKFSDSDKNDIEDIEDMRELLIPYFKSSSVNNHVLQRGAVSRSFAVKTKIVTTHGKKYNFMEGGIDILDPMYHDANRFLAFFLCKIDSIHRVIELLHPKNERIAIDDKLSIYNAGLINFNLLNKKLVIGATAMDEKSYLDTINGYKKAKKNDDKSGKKNNNNNNLIKIQYSENNSIDIKSFYSFARFDLEKLNIKNHSNIAIRSVGEILNLNVLQSINIDFKEMIKSLELSTNDLIPAKNIKLLPASYLSNSVSNRLAQNLLDSKLDYFHISVKSAIEPSHISRNIKENQIDNLDNRGKYVKSHTGNQNSRRNLYIEKEGGIFHISAHISNGEFQYLDDGPIFKGKATNISINESSLFIYGDGGMVDEVNIPNYRAKIANYRNKKVPLVVKFDINTSMSKILHFISRHLTDDNYHIMNEINKFEVRGIFNGDIEVQIPVNDDDELMILPIIQGNVKNLTALPPIDSKIRLSSRSATLAFSNGIFQIYGIFNIFDENNKLQKANNRAKKENSMYTISNSFSLPNINIIYESRLFQEDKIYNFYPSKIKMYSDGIITDKKTKSSVLVYAPEVDIENLWFLTDDAKEMIGGKFCDKIEITKELVSYDNQKIDIDYKDDSQYIYRIETDARDITIDLPALGKVKNAGDIGELKIIIDQRNKKNEEMTIGYQMTGNKILIEGGIDSIDKKRYSMTTNIYRSIYDSSLKDLVDIEKSITRKDRTIERNVIDKGSNCNILGKLFNKINQRKNNNNNMDKNLDKKNIVEAQKDDRKISNRAMQYQMLNKRLSKLFSREMRNNAIIKSGASRNHDIETINFYPYISIEATNDKNNMNIKIIGHEIDIKAIDFNEFSNKLKNKRKESKIDYNINAYIQNNILTKTRNVKRFIIHAKTFEKNNDYLFLLRGEFAKKGGFSIYTDPDIISMNTSNVGSVMKFLNITDDIKGGRMELYASSDQTNREIMNGNIYMEDFHLRRSNLAIHLLKLLAVSSIINSLPQLLNMDSIQFDFTECSFIKNGNEIKAQCDAAASMMNLENIAGTLDLKTSNYDFYGRLIPRHIINMGLGIIADILPFKRQAPSFKDKIANSNFHVYKKNHKMVFDINAINVFMPSFSLKLGKTSWRK